MGGCYTTGGPDPNKECIFPFRFKGVTYYSCTIADNADGDTSAWCSTKVDRSGNAVYGVGKWGKCESKCQPRNTGQDVHLKNIGQDCWNECGKQQGECDWCGKSGFCCRKANSKWRDKTNGCDGYFGGDGHHACSEKTYWCA